MTGAHGTGVSLSEWLAGRRPPVPATFAPWMEPADGSAPAGWEALLAETRVALDRALEPEGRPRKGAFDLLAADGFATWACEAALETGDPDAVLREMIQSLAG